MKVVERTFLHKKHLFCSALPAIHALTGCDTTCSLYGIGKKKALKIAMNFPVSDLEILSNLGKTITQDIIIACTKFISRLYDTKRKHVDKHSDINEMRVTLAKLKQLFLQKLPPAFPTFLQHLKRCTWQVYVWKNAYFPVIEILDPKEYGWQLINGQLIPVYFEGPTSFQLLQKYICNCSSKSFSCRTSVSCPCRAADLSCSKICKCTGKCGNNSNDESEDDE